MTQSFCDTSMSLVIKLYLIVFLLKKQLNLIPLLAFVEGTLKKS